MNEIQILPASDWRIVKILTITAYCLILGTMNYDAQANEQEGRGGALREEVSSRTQEHGEGAGGIGPKAAEQERARKRAWWLANTEKARASSKKWRDKNRDKINTRSAAWYRVNSERLKTLRKKRYEDDKSSALLQCKTWRAANAERAKTTARAWVRANKDRIAARRRAVYAANPEKYKADPKKTREQKHRRRALEKGASVGNLKVITKWEKSWRSKPTAICYWCQKRLKTSMCHVDHIQALAKGGAHSIENLCVSCAKCNRAKSVKSIENWNTEILQPVLF